MTFIWPVMLVLLVLVPVFLAIYLRLQQQRRKLAARYGSFGIVQAGMGHALGARRHVPPAFFFAGLAVLIVALARPQAMLNLPRVEGTVILAFDVSGSMAADDLKPTRMEAAKTAARDFIEKQPGTVQVGVVAFSDNGFSVQPPTADQAAILAAINRLTAQRGTSLANGITASLNTIAASRAQGIIGETNGEPPSLSNRAPEPTSTPTPLPKGTYTSAAIVLLTDGENNEMPDPLAVAQTAADRGVRIYTVAVGSPAGTTLKINGFTVHTQLNEEMLKQISAITGGEYYNADNEEELRAIYDNLDPQLLLKPQNTEITALFAGASIILLLIGGALSLVWFSRLP